MTNQSETDSAYELVSRYHVADDRKDQDDEGPLAIRLDHDRSSLNVDDIGTVKVTVENRGPKFAPMVVLDLPNPGGFMLERDRLDQLVAEGDVESCHVTTRVAIVDLLRSPSPSQWGSRTVCVPSRP